MAQMQNHPFALPMGEAQCTICGYIGMPIETSGCVELPHECGVESPNDRKLLRPHAGCTACAFAGPLVETSPGCFRLLHECSVESSAKDGATGSDYLNLHRELVQERKIRRNAEAEIRELRQQLKANEEARVFAEKKITTLQDAVDVQRQSLLKLKYDEKGMSFEATIKRLEKDRDNMLFGCASANEEVVALTTQRDWKDRLLKAAGCTIREQNQHIKYLVARMDYRPSKLKVEPKKFAIGVSPLDIPRGPQVRCQGDFTDD